MTSLLRTSGRRISQYKPETHSRRVKGYFRQQKRHSDRRITKRIKHGIGPSLVTLLAPQRRIKAIYS